MRTSHAKQKRGAKLRRRRAAGRRGGQAAAQRRSGRQWGGEDVARARFTCGFPIRCMKLYNDVCCLRVQAGLLCGGFLVRHDCCDAFKHVLKCSFLHTSYRV
jgi:hypothetical protein